MTTSTITRPTSIWLTVMLWLVANSLSFGLVGAMFHNFPLAFTFPPNLTRLGAFNLSPAIVGLVFGAIPALLIGCSQWALLRRHLPLPCWWIVSASAGMGLQHFFSDGFEHARDLSLAVLVSGLLAGVIQWRLLRPYLVSAIWWLPVSTLGWHVGWLIGIAILHSTGLLYRPWVSGLDGQQHGLLGLTTGLTLGLSTGLLWVWLSRNQKSE